MFDIEDKIVIITGASGGIGYAIAREFHQRGANLVLTSRSKDFQKRVSRDLKSLKNKNFVIQADLYKEKDIKKIVDFALRKFGRIDVLINCAGVNIRKKLGNYTSEDWDKILDLNLKSTFLIMQKVSKVMKKNSSGKIVNISSMQGVICWKPGEANLAPYCASKSGLISLTKSFALELAEYNITVNAICPAVVDGKWAGDIKKDKKIYKDIITRTPLRRLAKNEDIVGPALFFASKASDFITGHALLVDGGWTIE